MHTQKNEEQAFINNALFYMHAITPVGYSHYNM